MPLQRGDRLGPYEILAPLGAGGMGEVYRGRDGKLQRDVAVKILPAALANDAHYMARFEREAQMLAALNHPNIATVYGIEQGALVMELVEGADLKGPLPLDEAIAIAQQIATALEAAHEKGIIYRDLKPANIKITPAGVVKILDFGLAKSAGESNTATSDSSPTMSPTLSLEMTRAGMILGTAAYMSPEQARGRPVDKRTDIWSFGVVLYELITGRRLFEGDDLTEIMASVMKDSPDLSKVPAKVRRLLESCLEKDPRKRLRDIGDAWRLLEAPPNAAKSSVWPWAAAVLGVAAMLGAIAVWTRAGTSNTTSLTFDIVPPVGVTLNSLGSPAGAPVIAPDGSAVLYRGNDGFYVRRLDSMESKLVAGSSTSTNPAFWSADSTTVVHPAFGLGQLMKVKIPDGPPQAIAPISTPSRSGALSDSGEILFSAQAGTLLTVPATGGELKPVILSGPLIGHRLTYPEFLPASEDFVCFASAPQDARTGAIYLAKFRDGKALNPVLLTINDTPARYTPAGGGRILFVRNDNLYSQRLNLRARKLDGEPELLVQGVAYGDFSVARNGTIAWRPGMAAPALLTEFDRGGNVVGTPGPTIHAAGMAISPDGKQLMIYDRPRFLMNIGQTGRIELPKGVNWSGWSGGGAKLIGLRQDTLVEMASGGSGEIHELRKVVGDSPRTFYSSYDGRYFLREMQGELLTFRFDGTDQEVKPVAIKINGAVSFFLSPDDHWLLYASTESGRVGGIYVQPFPGPGPRRQIAATNSARMVWRGDGKEILYYEDGSLMSIVVTGGENPAFGKPRKLFSGLRLPPEAVSLSIPLAVSPDGSRIFWQQGVEQPESNVIHVKIGALR